MQDEAQMLKRVKEPLRDPRRTASAAVSLRELSGWRPWVPPGAGTVGLWRH